MKLTHSFAVLAVASLAASFPTDGGSIADTAKGLDPHGYEKHPMQSLPASAANGTDVEVCTPNLYYDQR